MADLVKLDEMLPAMLDTLKSDGKVTLVVTGNSMLPMLHHRKDEVTLVTPVFPLKRYDLPFYRRDDGAFVLHRIIKVCDGSYIIRGDNCNYIEPNMSDGHIIAVVESFKRNGKEYSVDNTWYKVYCALWCNECCYFLRKRVWPRVRAVLSKIKRMFIRK